IMSVLELRRTVAYCRRFRGSMLPAKPGKTGGKPGTVTEFPPDCARSEPARWGETGDSHRISGRLRRKSWSVPKSGQLPGFAIAACHVLVGAGVAREVSLRIVPIKALSGTVGDVGEKPALGQTVAVLDIAGAALPRLDGIQELADMPGRIRNARRRGTEGLLLLALHVHFVAVVVGHQGGGGSLA